MSKMGSHDPFGHLKHNLWPKERPRVKLTIWLPTTKSRESPWSTRVQVTCEIFLERSWRGLQLFFKPHLNPRFTRKVMGLQSHEVLVVRISRLPLGSPGTKCHFDVGLVERRRIYYKGEGGGFPQVQAVVSLVSLSLPMARPSTKSVPTMH